MGGGDRDGSIKKRIYVRITGLQTTVANNNDDMTMMSVARRKLQEGYDDHVSLHCLKNLR